MSMATSAFPAIGLDARTGHDRGHKKSAACAPTETMIAASARRPQRRVQYVSSGE
jgi:hypothetical protein